MPLPIVRLAIVTALALVATVSDADISRAISIAKSSDAERARFHAGYVSAVGDEVANRFEVVTEFRRAVLLGEERYRAGDRMFGVKQIRDLLQPWAGKLSVRAELRFHPQNVLVRVPDYDLVLGGPGPDEAHGTTTREPIYQIGAPGRSSTATPILGATVETLFDAASASPHATLVRLVLEGKIVAMTTFDFSRLD